PAASGAGRAGAAPSATATTVRSASSEMKRRRRRTSKPYRSGAPGPCARGADDEGRLPGAGNARSRLPRRCLMRRIAIAAIVAGCAAFGACGGGGGGGTSVPGGPGAAAPPTATPTPVPTSAAGTAAVTFQIEIPLTTRGTSALRRGVKYVSPGTESIAISVNGASPQVFSATTPGGPIAGCSTPSSNQAVVSCNWTLQVPPGPATFAVTLCSGTNGTGSILSQGSTSATIALGKPNHVAITFNGVPHALVLQLGTVAPPAGTASVISVVVYVVDAAGYAIVGPGTGTTATLTDTDPTSATYLYAPASNGACGTAPGGNTKSLAVTTGGLVNACLAYDGASSPSTITLDATANGLSEATAAMSPSGAQPTSAAVWTLAQPVYQNISGVVTPAPSPAILDAFDENVTTNAAPLVHISGDQTQIPDLTYASTYGPATVGLAADAKGDISIAYGHEIITFAPGSNGNVPPSAVTTFPSLSSVQSLSGLVYDASGNAYFAAVVGGASSCTLYRASIVNGSETPTTIGDCTHPLKNVTYSYATVGGLAFDSKGDLLVGFAGLPSGGQSSQSLVVRYVPNGGGSYVPSGAIAVKDLNDSEIPIPSVDAAGDITTYPYTYPGTSFVDDSVQTPNALAERNAFGLGFG